ncbi:hypothetical protein OsI_01151 [Oryza sativa Indica Group]|uniref:Uncharacterized protein n=2 Tax=Oryza TaxID=4527 RepID=A0A0E0FJE3_ORYNI|nr:hypothetical protein OsI_01151 [Oryza sativa Indica Group]
MASATMALSSSFAVAAAAAGGAPWRGVVSAGRAAPRRRVALVVRAQSEPEVEPTKEETATSSSSPSPATTPTPSPAAAAPKAKPAASTKLWDVLAFSGPAPERINGRLAMVGFVSALAVEASRGGGLLDQAGSGSGLAWFAATAAVLSAASLVPLLRGETAEARSGGVMSADAELWNGRFAMLGLVALAFTEFLTGSPLVNV